MKLRMLAALLVFGFAAAQASASTVMTETRLFSISMRIDLCDQFSGAARFECTLARRGIAVGGRSERLSLPGSRFDTSSGLNLLRVEMEFVDRRLGGPIFGFDVGPIMAQQVSATFDKRGAVRTPLTLSLYAQSGLRPNLQVFQEIARDDFSTNCFRSCEVKRTGEITHADSYSRWLFSDDSARQGRTELTLSWLPTFTGNGPRGMPTDVSLFRSGFALVEADIRFTYFYRVAPPPPPPVNPVPTPGAGLLALAAFGALGAIARRKRE